jgi:hypothetical protein
MKKVLLVLFAVALILCMAEAASAGSIPAIGFTGVTENDTYDSYSLGFEFTTNADIFVTHLGFYDDYLNGLSQDHDVGIYDTSQALLISATVTNSDPLDGFFHYTSVLQTLLSSGETYYVVGVTLDENYTWNPVGFLPAPHINFISSAFDFAPTGTLAFPIYSNGEVGYFGANFKYTLVPIPGAIWLLGSGLIGLLGLRVRFRK